MIVFMTENAAAVAKTLARGGYQADLVAGGAMWSGSDLKGKAGAWGGSYAKSRQALAKRMRNAGLHCVESLEAVGNSNRRLRVLLVEDRK